MDEIRAIVAQVRNAHVRALLDAFLDDRSGCSVVPGEGLSC